MSYKVYKMFYTFHVLRIYSDLHLTENSPWVSRAYVLCGIRLAVKSSIGGHFI